MLVALSGAHVRGISSMAMTALKNTALKMYIFFEADILSVLKMIYSTAFGRTPSATFISECF